VTDQVFLHEPTVVWERLEDVDQGGAVFVDSAFEQATPIGGDWAGWSPSPENLGTVDPVECVFPPTYDIHGVYWHWTIISRELALQLQNAEDERAQRVFARREQERAMQRREQERAMQRRRELARYEEEKKKEKNKKEKDCLIM
jgi:hypothetical protein